MATAECEKKEKPKVDKSRWCSSPAALNFTACQVVSRKVDNVETVQLESSADSKRGAKKIREANLLQLVRDFEYTQSQFKLYGNLAMRQIEIADYNVVRPRDQKVILADIAKIISEQKDNLDTEVHRKLSRHVSSLYGADKLSLYGKFSDRFPKLTQSWDTYLKGLTESYKGGPSSKGIPYEVLAGKRFAPGAPSAIPYRKDTAPIEFKDGAAFVTFWVLEKDGGEVRYKIRLASGRTMDSRVAELQAATAEGRACDRSVFLKRGKLTFSCPVYRIREDSTKTPKSGTMTVNTCPDALFDTPIVKDGRRGKPWKITASDMRSHLAERRRKNQEHQRARKAGTPKRKLLAKSQRQIAKANGKYDNLMDYCANVIIDRACKQHVSEIVYDCISKPCRGLEGFAWYDFGSKIESRANRHGIRFIRAKKAGKFTGFDKPVVYFCVSNSEPKPTHIKIGKTCDWYRREKELSVNSYGVTLLAAITCATEKKVHDKEKEMKNLFESANIKGLQATELYEVNPVLRWLIDNELLGNTGNLNDLRHIVKVPDRYEPAIETSDNPDDRQPIASAG